MDQMLIFGPSWPQNTILSTYIGFLFKWVVLNFSYFQFFDINLLIYLEVCSGLLISLGCKKIKRQLRSQRKAMV